MTLFASKNPTSDLDIVNIALAQLGADSISSFDENNKRARISNALYASSLRYVLSTAQWSFARKIVSLTMLAEGEYNVALYGNVYQKPSDSIQLIGLLPLTRRLKWELMNNQVHTGVNPAVMYYLTDDIPVGDFTPPFVQALAFYMAALMAYPITQDDELGNTMLTRQFPIMLADAIASDATIGSTHMQLDRNPKHDTFVTSGEEDVGLTEEDLMFASRYLLPVAPDGSGTLVDIGVPGGPIDWPTTAGRTGLP